MGNRSHLGLACSHEAWKRTASAITAAPRTRPTAAGITAADEATEGQTSPFDDLPNNTIK